MRVLQNQFFGVDISRLALRPWAVCVEEGRRVKINFHNPLFTLGVLKHYSRMWIRVYGVKRIGAASPPTAATVDVRSGGGGGDGGWPRSYNTFSLL